MPPRNLILLRGRLNLQLSAGQLPYCRRHDLRAYGFYWWRRELSRRDAQPPPPLATFVPVTVVRQPPVPAGTGRIEIVLSGGRRVRMMGSVDKGMLADVLAVLAAGGGREEGVAC